LANSKVITNSQSVNDIKKAILSSFENDKKEYDKISTYFVGQSVYATCKNVFDFLRKHVKNITEGVEIQSVKSPAAIIATGNTIGSDCKNYSLFAAGVLDSINRKGWQKIPVTFRFCRYKQFDGSFLEHVFIVVNAGKKNEIWVDCIKDVPYFNNKRYPDFYTDKKINSMALVRMSGTSDNQKETIVNGLLSERAKRLASGKIIAGSVQDKRYIKALGSMGVTMLPPPQTSFTQTLINQQVKPTGNTNDFLKNFMNSGGGGGITSVLGDLLSGGGLGGDKLDDFLKTGISTAANAFLPGSGMILQPILNLFGNKDNNARDFVTYDSKDDRSGEPRGNDAFGWSVANPDKNEKLQLTNVLGYLSEYGFTPYYVENILKNAAKFYEKMKRVGFESEAVQILQLSKFAYENKINRLYTQAELMQAYNASLQKTSGKGTTSATVVDSVNSGGGINPLLLIGGGVAAIMLLKK
jgi:hypothetical protein